MNNVRKSIGWADYTWNPVTGCKGNCPYCYARRIHDRFSKSPFSDLVFHEERLSERMPRKPSRIFVGSMSEVAFWKPEWKARILKVCADNDNHTFMFLTKRPLLAYTGAFLHVANVWCGCTITGSESKTRQRDTALQMPDTPRTFASIEPILGYIDDDMPIRKFGLVIIGAMTGPGKIIPKLDWLRAIVKRMDFSKQRIYWKGSLRNSPVITVNTW